MKFVKFKTEFELVSPKSAGLAEPVRSECMDITFVNLGATAASVNNMPLLPGASLPIGANQSEYNNTIYQVVCAQPVAGLGVWVMRKLFDGEIEMHK